MVSIKGTILFFDDTFINLNDVKELEVFKNIRFHYFCYSPFVKLNQENINKFNLLLDQILIEYKRENYFEEAIKMYVKLLLIDYQRAMKAHAYQCGAVNRYDQVIRLRADIEQNFLTEKRADFYAQKQNLSVKRLNEISKQALQKTITNLIHERLLLEAKNLLNHTPKSIKEICYHLGYEDTTYFYRFFKKHEGIPPEEYRNYSMVSK